MCVCARACVSSVHECACVSSVCVCVRVFILNANILNKCSFIHKYHILITASLTFHNSNNFLTTRQKQAALVATNRRTGIVTGSYRSCRSCSINLGISTSSLRLGPSLSSRSWRLSTVEEGVGCSLRPPIPPRPRDSLQPGGST